MRRSFVVALCCLLLASVASAQAAPSGQELTAEQGQTRMDVIGTPMEMLKLSRPVRSWEYIDAVGEQASILGWENGTFEAWAYPLRILRDFRLSFRSNQRVIPAESLARTVTVRPESTSILYATDNFSVRETLFVPLHEPGAVIELEVDAFAPLEIDASFQPDMQLMWPAAVGGAGGGWNDSLHAFALSADGHPFFALVGSPEARRVTSQYQTNYSSSSRDAFSLPQVEKSKKTFLIVIAASLKDEDDAEARYRRLRGNYPQLREQAAEYYQEYLTRTVSLRLPDTQLQTAYDWARVSLVQGMVENPYLGRGLVAGYRTTERPMRPGFAWFFGRDSLWSDLALTSEGDVDNTRQALDFLSRFQRADGKIPHEIPQTFTFVPWFKNYPYGYSAADSTPLFILAMNDYATSSGDVGFVRAKWENLQRAYRFLKSTYASYGWPENAGVGSGWMEGGPLWPMGSEFYLSGLAVSATRAMANLARMAGEPTLAADMESEFARQEPALNQAFWSPSGDFLAIGLNQQGERVDVASVLTTVPLWFDVVDAAKAQSTIDVLAGPEHSTDWGMRNGSDRNPGFDPAGYQFGTVWPLFTGWAAVGEYRYHRALPAYANLRANALLTLDGALGHTAEVLSGMWYQPMPSSCPHQIWSSAMVVSPMLRGMMGLSVDAGARLVRLVPHIPASWNEFRITGVRASGSVLDFDCSRTENAIVLSTTRSGGSETSIEFSPALSLHAEVIAAEVNGRPVKFQLQRNATDQHPVVRFVAGAGRTTVSIRLRGDFGIEVPAPLPPLGTQSRNLKVISETWDSSHRRLELRVAGIAGREYELRYYGAAPVGVEGAQLDSGAHLVRLHMPDSAPPGYKMRTVVLTFP